MPKLNSDPAFEVAEPAAAPAAARSGLLRRWLTAPALRFVAFGAVLFAIARDAPAEPPPGRIVVDEALSAQLGERFEQLHGRPPSEEERARAIEAWATDEALFREARALQLVERDAVVRKRLVQNMEFLLEAEAPPAGEAALRAYYAAHPDDYRKPEARSFEHVFVAGRTGRARVQALGDELTRGAAPGSLGDPSVYGPKLAGLTSARMTALFGEELSAQAFDLPAHTWSAPLASPLGWHLLRLLEVSEARVPPFEQVRGLVAQHQAAQARAEALRAGRQALRARYQVEVVR